MSKSEGAGAVRAPQEARPKAPALRDSTPWRVLCDWLGYPADDAQLARLLAGEKIGHRDRKTKVARAGEIVKDLPAKSVPSLLAAGRICKPDSAEDPFKAQVTEPEAGGAS